MLDRLSAIAATPLSAHQHRTLRRLRWLIAALGLTMFTASFFPDHQVVERPRDGLCTHFHHGCDSVEAGEGEIHTGISHQGLQRMLCLLLLMMLPLGALATPLRRGAVLTTLTLTALGGITAYALLLSIHAEVVLQPAWLVYRGGALALFGLALLGPLIRFSLHRVAYLERRPRATVHK